MIVTINWHDDVKVDKMDEIDDEVDNDEVDDVEILS